MPNWLRTDTWIISDTHFGHDNIAKYCDRPDKHDFLIMDNWHKIVGSKDVVLHLGDLTVWYGIKQRTWEDACRHLPGRKKLIIGNHDERPIEFYESMGFTVLEPFTARVGIHTVHFSHEPMYEKGEWDINVHGHVHNNGHRSEGVDELPEWCRNVSIEVMNYRPVHLGDIL